MLAVVFCACQHNKRMHLRSTKLLSTPQPQPLSRLFTPNRLPTELVDRSVALRCRFARPWEPLLIGASGQGIVPKIEAHRCFFGFSWGGGGGKCVFVLFFLGGDGGLVCWVGLDGLFGFCCSHFLEGGVLLVCFFGLVTVFCVFFWRGAFVENYLVLLQKV